MMDPALCLVDCRKVWSGRRSARRHPRGGIAKTESAVQSVGKVRTTR
jgi:hypothetical protein